ncbi:MAG: HepT-like ribonuclease domain-containing protein [Haloechinothrix sp.]
MTPRTAVALINLHHTLERIAKITAKGRTAVEGDEFLPLAAQQLGIRLGHDVAALPEEWRATRPEIPWHSIRGLRTRLAHNYHEVDFDILWDAFVVNVPAMRDALSKYVDIAREVVAPPPNPSE